MNNTHEREIWSLCARVCGIIVAALFVVLGWMCIFGHCWSSLKLGRLEIYSMNGYHLNQLWIIPAFVLEYVLVWVLILSIVWSFAREKFWPFFRSGIFCGLLCLVIMAGGRGLTEKPAILSLISGSLMGLGIAVFLGIFSGLVSADIEEKAEERMES